MKISEKGIHHIKNYEGFRAKPYLCPAGYWTVGYGERISLAQVAQYNLKPMTEVEATQRLLKLADKFAAGVLSLVKVPLTQGQLDALASFAFNLGLEALKSSTLLRQLNAGTDKFLVANQFKRWNKAVVKGKGMIELPGLSKRREAERLLFLS